ncbi:hypothetical protein WH47_01557 [Habropoda laboriosa]|uniref:Filamentous hemagglutinin n=1 Tax=Habropoda laboriosa TaxID=597456 RepID=A0A0L7R0K8_9HYME|nr:hypothetical protein WH47_01557 [Habropoda laboriosa]
MHLNVSFLFLLLGITLIQAGPAAKIIEKKSLAETVEAEAKQENLNIEESGEEKDRTKKAALYFQIQPNCQQPVKENLVTVQNIPLRIQAQSVPPQIHTLNVLQPIVQTLPQPSIIIPQQPIPNLHIAQHPAQPSSAVNVIQSSSNTNVIHGIEKQQPQPKPKPTPAPVTETVPVTEKPKPMRIEQQAQPLPKPQETLALLPMAPTYEEHLMFIPEQPQFVPLMEVPATTPCTNPLHNYLTSCTCSNVRPLAMNMVPVMPYPSAYARSSMMMPHMVAEKIRVEPQGRTNTHIDLNIPNHRHHHPHHHSHDSLPESTLRNKENTMHSPVASEASNLIQTNKSPRETNTNQLSPEKMLEIKQEQSQAMLIDGRRNVRSNKEKSKERKSESTKN